MVKLQEDTDATFGNCEVDLYNRLTQFGEMCTDSPSYYNRAINRRITQTQLRVNLSLCPHILQLLCGNPLFRQETLSVQVLTAKWFRISVIDGHRNEELIVKTLFAM